MSKLRSFLQKERDTRGWSMTDLSEKSGISLSNISRWESTKNTLRVSHDNVLALARVFEMEPGDVLRFIGYPRRQFKNNAERDEEWGKLRDRLESDPRAKRMIELYDQSTSEDAKDRAVDLLEVHFRKRPPDPQ